MQVLVSKAKTKDVKDNRGYGVALTSFEIKNPKDVDKELKITRKQKRNKELKMEEK